MNSTNDAKKEKTAEKMLYSNDALSLHYQTLAQISPVGIFHTDAKGTTTYVNPMWCQISGLSAGKAMKDGWMQAVHPDDQKKLKANWKASVKEQTASSAEYRFIHPDGSIIWVIGQAVPEKNAEGKTIGYVGTITDITEGKGTEEKLVESEKNLQEKISGLRLLYDTTSKILETDTYENIYTIMGEMLFQFSGADYMIMSEYKEESKSVVIKQLFGTKPYLETIARKIAIDFSKVKIPVKDLADQLNFSHRRKIYPVEGGLYSLTAKNIPKPICKAIEKITGLQDLYSIGFIWEENYYGGVAFGFKKGKEFKNQDLIESFVSQASLALSIKYAEKALIISEDRFRTIFNESPIGIELYDADGTIHTANKSDMKMFGITNISEGLGFNLFVGKTLSLENKEKLRRGEQIAYESAYDFETVKKLQQYKTGKTGKAYFDYVITPLLDAKTKIIQGYLLQVQDITERKLADEKQRESEEKLQTVFNLMAEGMALNELVFDDTGEIVDYIIIEANPAFERINSLSREQVIRMNATKLYGLSSEYINSFWKQHINDKQSIATELFNEPNNVWLDVSTSIPVQNKFTTVLSDITDRKLAERELILAKQKAEESDKLKTSFLHNISHEIRTPLNGLLGFLSILQESDVDPGQRDEYIDIINKSAFRFMNTVDDIVEVSQIQAGLLKITVSEINVRRLINELCSRYQPEAEFKRLKFLLKDELPVSFESISTDGNKLNAIISILLNNAVKFTKEGSIEFGCDLVETHCRASLLQFYVKDTGIGIPKDRQEDIFKHFRQVDDSDTRPFEGSGLGLSIAKAYIEMLGGKIWLESDPGGQSGKSGSTFYFTIPINTESTEKPCIENFVPIENTVNPTNPESQLLKILIVEDDEVSELYLRRAIKLFCKEILHAGNGAEAVEASRKNPDVDLILMDIKMTGMNGYEATRQIRQFNKKVIIVAQTAYGQISDRQKALESGCNDYISKPVKKELLVELVGKYFKI
jgi:PAS domain S-box-containing protein